MDVLLEEDRPLMEKEWHNLTVLRMKRTIELRLRKKWYHQASSSWRNTWILVSASHEENKDGTTLKSIMGCITNISLQKQAQEDALARAALSEQLTESEKKFKQMAELSPCGMCTILNYQGCNSSLKLTSEKACSTLHLMDRLNGLTHNVRFPF